MHILQELTDRKLAHPPKWLNSNVVYLTWMGSLAYGVNQETSDRDVYGIVIPRKEEVFPHLAGHIEGFGKQRSRFEQYQEHHIEYNKDVYDFTVFNIVKYFTLLMDNNPNCIDAIYTPRTALLVCTHVGNIIRENRDLFLHKGCYHKLKGYAYSQAHKLRNKNSEGRKELIEKYGMDTKYAYHLVRLLNECEMIMVEGTLDLHRNLEQLKSIRKGEWTLEQVLEYFEQKEKTLEKLYAESKLRMYPDEDAIKNILLQCLEAHYGSIDNCIQQDRNGVAVSTLRKIKEIIDEFI